MSDNIAGGKIAGVLEVYLDSSGEKTAALYARLGPHDLIGHVAVELLRACTSSELSKRYRGKSRGAAYGKKG
jgi:hypothetical protein